MEEMEMTSTTISTENDALSQNGAILNSSLTAEPTCSEMDSESKCIKNGNNDDLNNEDACLFRLVFRDETTFNDLQQIISKCLRDTMFGLKKSLNVVVDKNQHSIEFCEIAADNNDSMFMVDTLPAEQTNEVEIPNYSSSAVNMLDDTIEIEPKDDDSGEDAKFKMGMCWNCSGDHTLKDCKEPRDAEAINKAKQLFSQKSKTERYHLDAEQRYGHLAPGSISDTLRRALGLRSRELPSYIYQMRKFGYPPGWLEDAKISHSGLTLFNAENEAIPDKSLEDGESDKVTYDATKFIEFPGFNAELPPHILDESDYYNVPAMKFSDSKEGLSQEFNLAKSYKRKRQKRDVDGDSSEYIKSDDMDLECSDEDSPESPPPPPVTFPQPRPPTELEESSSNAVPENNVDTSCDSNRLSLTELQRKQEELLRALADASDQDSNSSPSLANENGKQTVETNNGNETATNIAEEMVQSMDSEVNIQVPIPIPTTPQASGRSKGTMSGTPLLKQVSPYSRLPVGEKWSIGVTDVIDFENLPDSTGTYQKLTDVIRKVRTFVKQSNDESDQ